MIQTLKHPNMIINGQKNGKDYRYYIKNFKEDIKNKAQFEVIRIAPDGSFYSSSYRLKNSKFNKIINEGQIIYDLSHDLTAMQNASVSNIIPHSDEKITSNEGNVTKHEGNNIQFQSMTKEQLLNVYMNQEFGLRHPNTTSAGKIDIIYLPPFPDVPKDKIGDFIRNKVKWYLGGNG